MNDEHFFDLAMKVIAHQCTDAERAELDALLAREPELKTEFMRLQAEARIAKEALPLVNATEATEGEFPAYARGRLQTKVRQILGRPKSESTKKHDTMRTWRLAFGFAATAAIILLVALPMFRAPNAPVIQLAMLDTTGGTRGGDTNDVLLLRETWKAASLETFTSADALREWETKDKSDAVKIIYDRAAAEVKVFGRWKGKTVEKTFLVEVDLAAALKEAKNFIAEQTQK